MFNFDNFIGLLLLETRSIKSINIAPEHPRFHEHPPALSAEGKSDGPPRWGRYVAHKGHHLWRQPVYIY